jgi:hypothetical protein
MQYRKYVSASAVLAVACLAAACATSGGATYSRGASGEGAAFARAAAAEDEADAEQPAQPAKPAPTQPAGGQATPSQPSPGWTTPAKNQGNTVVVVYAPPVPVGRVVVSGAPAGAVVTVDGRFVLGNEVTMATGAHEVRVAAFGWDQYSEEVWVARDTAVRVAYRGGRLPFALTDLSAEPPEFAVDQPGAAGVVFAGRASAAGRADVEVFDADGRPVRRLASLDIYAADWSARWDGCDESGRRVAPGRYFAMASGVGADGAHSRSPAAPVEAVAGGSPQRASALASGLSGALFAPDARVRPAGWIEAAAAAIGHVEAVAGGISSRTPVFGGLRVGLGDLAEIALSGGATLRGEPSGPDLSSWRLSAAAKAVLLDESFASGFGAAAAVYGRASFGSYIDPAAGGWPSPRDGLANYPGVAGGFALEARTGATRLFGGVEAVMSDFYPGWDDGRWPVPGYFAWGYLRLGADVLVPAGKAGWLGLTLSGAARTAPTVAGLALEGPYGLGAELRWYSATSAVVPCLAGTVEIDKAGAYFVSGGVGFSFF